MGPGSVTPGWSLNLHSYLFDVIQTTQCLWELQRDNAGQKQWLHGRGIYFGETLL